jgi:hypothetical protein
VEFWNWTFLLHYHCPRLGYGAGEQSFQWRWRHDGSWKVEVEEAEVGPGRMDPIAGAMACEVERQRRGESGGGR